MQKTQTALLQIHGAVLLFALSGLFGKWLAVPAFVIVFARAGIAAITIAIVLKATGQAIKLSHKRQHIPLAITGAMLAFHWLTFFYSIQLSSVTIGLLTFASFPIFVSLIEPLMFKEPFKASAIVQGLLTLVGIYFVVPLHQVSESDLQGGLVGLLSAFSFAILTLLNRKFSVQHCGRTLAMMQNFYAALVLLPVMLFYLPEVSMENALGLILLGVVFTALAHSLYNLSLSVIKAQTASIIVTMEPVYGVIAAIILLSEPLTVSLVIGSCLIIGVNIWAMKQAKVNTGSSSKKIEVSR